MITLENDSLTFRFPDVHPDAECTIDFKKTLRIPDTDKTYPLPPGLGNFSLRHLDDYAEKLPEDWKKRGGVIMPMYQSEAMWINFGGHYPCAVKIAAGKINAVTGETWSGGLNRDPQDYMTIPDQPWLDGYCIEKGTIRQFVAMPLGRGYSAEEQIQGTAEHGGIQICVFPMKAERYLKFIELESDKLEHFIELESEHARLAMGIAPGGRMKQEIYDDNHGLDSWDLRTSGRCFISIANSAAWEAVTGEAPQGIPPSAKSYADAGLPWFDHYGGDKKAVSGSAVLSALKSVSSMGKQKGEKPLPENDPAAVGATIFSGKKAGSTVREAEF